MFIHWDDARSFQDRSTKRFARFGHQTIRPAMTKLSNVMISGGGTGGHIHPALAIADEIKKRNPQANIRFVGALGRMEMTKVPASGYPIDGLWISGIERSMTSMKNWSFPFKLLSSLMTSRKLLKKHQPQVVVGVGGFASGPLLYQAARKGIPTLIQEQNSFPGITNRILANRVDRICAGLPGLSRWFPSERIVETGNPLRKSVCDSWTIRLPLLRKLQVIGVSPTNFRLCLSWEEA